MKVDGLVKVMLVAIVGLLVWSCVQNMGSDNGEGRNSSVSFGTAAHAASIPDFIQEGKWYFLAFVGGCPNHAAKVDKIDKGSGWVHVHALSSWSYPQKKEESVYMWRDQYYEDGGYSWINFNQVVYCTEVTDEIQKINSQPE